ncbi:MAG: dinitrogenase iron-molybdenum cofactor biosynthesis protein [Gammaproteobacteria bacterium]|nr:dinitrogenase iron-molybdenum cofactor biosynthesis protein [Gammaproteobacteria bacterium]
MSQQSLSNEIALRIGLAARELPDTDAARLLRVLDDAVGLPPTRKALAELTLKKLKSAADNELSGIDAPALRNALSILQGEADINAEPLPEIEAYRDGDLPGSIRVACASNKGEKLDGHFGSCRRFLIYQVSSNGLKLIDIRPIDDSQASDDMNGYRASLIGDCQLLFVASIGGPAAVKVVRAGVHPIKKPEMGDARPLVAELQGRIGPDAPPWLAKVMGQAPEERIRFEPAHEEVA